VIDVRLSLFLSYFYKSLEDEVGSPVSLLNTLARAFFLFILSKSFFLNGILLINPNDTSHPSSPYPPQPYFGINDTVLTVS